MLFCLVLFVFLSMILLDNTLHNTYSHPVGLATLTAPLLRLSFISNLFFLQDSEEDDVFVNPLAYMGPISDNPPPVDSFDKRRRRRMWPSNNRNNNSNDQRPLHNDQVEEEDLATAGSGPGTGAATVPGGGETTPSGCLGLAAGMPERPRTAAQEAEDMARKRRRGGSVRPI